MLLWTVKAISFTAFFTLKLGVYDYAIGNAYSSLYAQYEKLGDYVINVTEAIDGSRKHSED
jgi:hypothetical protein